MNDIWNEIAEHADQAIKAEVKELFKKGPEVVETVGAIIHEDFYAFEHNLLKGYDAYNEPSSLRVALIWLYMLTSPLEWEDLEYEHLTGPLEWSDLPAWVKEWYDQAEVYLNSIDDILYQTDELGSREEQFAQLLRDIFGAEENNEDD